MPGVLIVEAMAQTAAVLVVATFGAESEGKLVYFMSIDGVRFRRPVMPGDRLELHVEKIQSRANVWKFSGKAMVEGKVAAEATFAAMIRDKSSRVGENDARRRRQLSHAAHDDPRDGSRQVARLLHRRRWA